MTRSLGSGSSIPREGTPQTPMMEAARGGEPEPNDCGEVAQKPALIRYADGAGGIRGAKESRDARGTRSGNPLSPQNDSRFGPSNVQLALAQAHVLWAKRHAPHLLEEWLR